jgi:glycosyltransferase involved in cell wall biosynthesis
MRIAIITSGFSKDENDFGGAAAFHNLVKELSLSDDIDVTVFSFYYPVNQAEYRFYNAKVFSFASGKSNFFVSKLRTWRKCEKKFAAEHKSNPFNIIHSMWARESGFVAAKLSRKFKIPMIANIAGGELADLKQINYGSRTRQLQKYFVDKTFSKADIIISGSDYITEKIESYYESSITSKVRKLPFGVDENMFSIPDLKTTPLKNEKLPTLINIANAVPVKSHDTLFKALKIVSEKFPSVQMECYGRPACAGRDDKNILKELAGRYGVKDNIRLNGFIDYENIPQALNKESIFVLSSLYESQNMAIIEAAFCGLPVVSTNVGAAAEITEHITEPGNSEMLAEKIIYVMENYTQEKQKALSKRESLVSKYSLKVTTQNIINLYKSLISS